MKNFLSTMLIWFAVLSVLLFLLGSFVLSSYIGILLCVALVFTIITMVFQEQHRKIDGLEKRLAELEGNETPAENPAGEA